MGGRDHSIECETCGMMRGGFDRLLCACDASDPLPALNWSPEFVHALITNSGETCYDDRCWWHVGRPALTTLAANLAVAGALCLADSNGYDRAAMNYAARGDWWRPGCGRKAPGNER